MGVPKIRHRSPKMDSKKPDIYTSEVKKGIGYNGKEKLLNTKQHQKKCVYCEDTDHNFTYCEKVESITERKKLLMEKKLCFNSTG